MSRPRVVAIDGAAGSGKSTLARGLALRLALPYVNTGLMYRALAAAALDAGVSTNDQEALTRLASNLEYRLTSESPPTLEVDGWPAERLTTLEVESTVSAVARHPRVREVLRSAQRELGRGGAVMEGRDITTVVFPDAPVRLFLVADPGERAARRAGERQDREGVVVAALAERDRRDARTNPLEPAVGVVVIDTGVLDITAALHAALSVVRERAPELMA